MISAIDQRNAPASSRQIKRAMTQHARLPDTHITIPIAGRRPPVASIAPPTSKSGNIAQATGQFRCSKTSTPRRFNEKCRLMTSRPIPAKAGLAIPAVNAIIAKAAVRCAAAQ